MTSYTHTPLLYTLRHLSVLRAPPGQPFKLASGKESMVYVDVRLTALNGHGGLLLAEHLVAILDHHVLPSSPRPLLAGVVVGGCPLVTAMSMLTGLDVLYVRKEAKGHGTDKLIEGRYQEGDAVVLVEDVVTSGASSVKAAQVLTDAGLQVIGILAVLDRGDGGRKTIEDAGYTFVSLFTLSQLLTEE